MLSHFGWYPDTYTPERFLLGRTLLGAEPQDALAIEIDPAIYERAQEFDLGEGSAKPLDDWSDAAGMLFAMGCEPQAFSLLASFAAPLMAFWPGGGSSAVVSIHGSKHCGKSTAIAAAASVWGAPTATMLRKPNTTEFERLGNLPMLTETLVQRDPNAVTAGIETFAYHQRRAKWASILISASPIPLGDICPVPGAEFELSVPRALIRPRNADHIAERLLACRGHAGRRFIGYLMDSTNRRSAKSQMAAKIATLREESDDDDDERLPAMRAIAACAVAGAIAENLGMIEQVPDRLIEWAIDEMFVGDMQQRKARAEKERRT